MKYASNRLVAVRLFAVGLALVCGSGQALADGLRLESLWQQAIAYEDQGLFDDAVAVYEAILAVDPASQRAAVMAVVDLFLAGRHSDANARSDDAIGIDPFNREWASWGYLYKAKACQSLGCVDEARRALAVLEDRFPESILTAEGKIIAAELDGVDATGLEAAYARELAAEVDRVAALDEAVAGHHGIALTLFDAAIAAHAGTRQALQALEDKAVLLSSLPGREQEAQAALQTLLGILGNWPQSGIHLAANRHLALLERKSGDRAAAYARLRSVADTADDQLVATESAVQAAAVKLEMIQIDQMTGRNVRSGDWTTVRSLLGRVDTSQRVAPAVLAQAGLKMVESLAWEGRPRDAVAAADVLLASVDEVKFSREAATVRLFAAEELLKLGEPDRALVHFSDIVVAFAGEKEIWVRGDHLPRAYFRVWETLRKTEATASQVTRAADELLRAFPESSYAEHVRIVQRQEAE